MNTGGRLRAYNTDYLAVVKLLADRQVPADRTFAVLGSGGMAKAVVAALRDAGLGRPRSAGPSPYPQTLAAESTVELRCGSGLAVPACLVGWSVSGYQAKGGDTS